MPALKPMKREKLFVYGTLRSGDVGHAQMLGAISLGLRRTTPGYCVSRLIGTNLPGLIELKGALGVSGELYSVTPHHLDRIDRYEDARYFRRRVHLTSGERAWAYFLTAAKDRAA